MAIEDKWSSIGKTLKYGCSYLAGVYLPALNSNGSSDFRIEYVHTSILQYRHNAGQYTDGFTIDNKLLGSDAGSDADTVYVHYRQTVSPKLQVGLMLGWDYRRSDTYAETIYSDFSTGSIYKIGWGPREQRYRGTLDASWRLKDNLRIYLIAGYERVRNYNFIQNDDRNNYLAALALKWNFDNHFSFSAN